MPDCSKKYIIVKFEGCNMVQRAVYSDESGKKYVKYGGKNVYLSDIRGKYRYLDKTV